MISANLRWRFFFSRDGALGGVWCEGLRTLMEATATWIYCVFFPFSRGKMSLTPGVIMCVFTFACGEQTRIG